MQATGRAGSQPMVLVLGWALTRCAALQGGGAESSEWPLGARLEPRPSANWLCGLEQVTESH